MFEEIEKDVAYYRNSGGGVTVSGGEPLAQSEFVLSLLKQCQKAGLHTTVDTCGYVKPEDFKKALPYTNLVFYDLKHVYGPIHKKLTGVSNRRILNNLRLVAQSGVKVIVRIPVIPEFNDSPESMIAMADFVAGLGSVKEVNLLPYHRFGVGKYEMLDRPYLLDSKLPPDRPHLDELRKLFVASGKECEIVE